MRRLHSALIGIALLACALNACRSARGHRELADERAYQAIDAAQRVALQRVDDFDVRPAADTLRQRLLHGQELPTAGAPSFGVAAVEPIEQIADTDYFDAAIAQRAGTSGPNEQAVRLDLIGSLQVAARNSRGYQEQKEQVFETALRLDLEHDRFRFDYGGNASAEGLADLRAGEDELGVEGGLDLDASRRFRNGMDVAAGLGLDLVKLLSFDEASSFGIVGDLSISIPLLRGSSRFVISEPLRQAERNLVYAIYDFERFKRRFAVDVAADYLAVLEQLDRVDNAAENYRGLVAATRRAQRLAEAGRLPEVQVDQARQDELRARDRWVSASQAYARRLDGFKQLIGLPTDAEITLDRDEFERLAQRLRTLLQTDIDEGDERPASAADAPVELREPANDGGDWELETEQAIRTALAERLDLRVALGRVHDALRLIAVAADDLRADITLLGSASVGSRRTLAQAGLADAEARVDRGAFSVLIDIDLPLERAAERESYRRSWIMLEARIRAVQELEDEIKFAIRDALRVLVEAREAARIQALAVRLARRRVESTQLFLQAGRAEIRDLLEAQESLVTAENALTAALIRYRVAEWEMQRDLGVLDVAGPALWRGLVGPATDAPDAVDAAPTDERQDDGEQD